MTATIAAPDNTAAVVSIGRRTLALGKTVDQTAAAIIASHTELVGEVDWTARGAKPGAVHMWATGSAAKADWPAQKDESKKPTAYGVGVDTLVHAITRLLVADEVEKPVAMRVSLTGVGSAVVPADHPAYALLLALLGAEQEAAEAADES